MNEIKTYTFWQLIRQYKIEIPIVQRDYAQGRGNKKTNEIRRDFLNAIYDHLHSKSGLELDFVYGKVSDDYFIPIDGQQRLTTLFLLHWYIAIRTGDQDVINEFRQIWFAYKTRISARDFSLKLIQSLFDFDESEQEFLLYIKKTKTETKDVSGKYLSFVIKSAPWFFLSWQKDPTVQSMMHMLDAIHVKFSKVDFKLIWGRLSEPNYSLSKENPKLNRLITILADSDNDIGEIAELVKQIKKEPAISFKFLNLDDF